MTFGQLNTSFLSMTKSTRRLLISLRFIIGIIVIVTTTILSTKTAVSAFVPSTGRTTLYRLSNGMATTTTTTTTTTTDAADSSNEAIIQTDVAAVKESIDSIIDDTNFLPKAKKLCDERNIKFDKIKNARDLASPIDSTIKSGILYRTGRVSDASATDIKILLDELKIRTLIDLRSPTELKDDPTLLRSDVFGNFTTMVWQERRAGKSDCLKELQSGQPPFRPKGEHFWSRSSSTVSNTSSTSIGIVQTEVDVETLEQALLNDNAIVVNDEDAIIFDDDEDCAMNCLDNITNDQSKPNRRERHFVSLMNEFKYVKGTASKVRKRDITKAILKAPGAVFSKRVRASLKKPFLDEINDGGLPMLNELLLRFGSPGIRYVLELCADERRHPIAFYCTAGKDRTGIIAAIILSLCNVKEESIIEDYSLSANVYAEMNDHTAMVGALSQRSLDPKRFLIAPPSVMKDTLAAINEQYGSVEEYCTWIGFTPDKQQQLRNACMKK